VAEDLGCTYSALTAEDLGCTYGVMGQPYKVKRHAGTRSRPMISLTLAPEEVAILDRVAAKRGMSKSTLVGQLLRGLDQVEAKKGGA
jgi:hypothetical protein